MLLSGNTAKSPISPGLGVLYSPPEEVEVGAGFAPPLTHGTAALRAHRRARSGLLDGPFGRTFTFADPDGYHVTLHDKA